MHPSFRRRGLHHDLRIPLTDIVIATNDFAHQNLIEEGKYEDLYKGKLFRSEQLVNVVVQRLYKRHWYRYDTLDKIQQLCHFKHKNIASIVGFCAKDDEIIIVNEQVVNGSLEKYLRYPILTWMQRLHICLGVAHTLRDCGLIYGNIKSSKILLDKDWEAKVLGITSYNLHHIFLGNTRSNDVYNLGVLLFEVVCDTKKVIGDGDRIRDLATIVRRHYQERRLHEIIDPNLRKQMHPQSLLIFLKTAYKCFIDQRQHKIGDVVRNLEEALELQLKHEDTVATPPFSWKVLERLKIQLSDIVSSTKNFAKEYCIGLGAYGTVYKAELDYNIVGREGEILKKRGIVAIKRISNRQDEQGSEQGFFIELEMLSRCKHPNIVALLGYCNEDPERILVYEYAFKRSLDEYLGSTDKTTNLTWAQRIRICLDVARGLNYLHNNTYDKPRIIHRDIKSANILLGERWNAMIADFGLSKFHPVNLHASTINTNNIAGTKGYLDPVYLETGKLKKASDIYSFGVVLFEMLFGRLAYDPVFLEENDKGLASFARRRFNEGTLMEMVDPTMKEADELIRTLYNGPNQDSLDTFSELAYRCLAETQDERPTVDVVINELLNALNFQENRKDTLKVSLEDIKSGTSNFSDNNCIMRGAFGNAYKGELQYHKRHKTVVAKRLSMSCQEDYFLTELEILFKLKHKNVIGLVGYCKEMNEKIIVYEDATKGSLDMHLDNVSLGWTERLKICIDVASGLDFLHGDVMRQGVVLHRDIKSASILLNGDWEAKISDFGLSLLIDPINKKMGPAVHDVLGTPGYYREVGFLTKESDMYALGVVLFEIMCSRLMWEIQNDNGRYLDDFVQEYFEKGRLNEIVFKGIGQQILPQSLYKFQEIAYKCLHQSKSERPTAREVIVQLKKALELQEDYEKWEPQLPTDYAEILQMSKSPDMYSNETKKNLYNMLRKGMLLQKGKKWFSLGKDGERIEMISSRMFSYKNPRSLCWRYVPESRFQKVAEMLDISNLKIQILIRTQSLSPGINYRVHLIFKFCSQRKSLAKRMYVNLKYKKGSENLHSYFATWREDGWMMVELCRFSTHKGDADFKVLLESFSRCYSGSRAIYIEGIEFRAIDNVKHEEIDKLKEVQNVSEYMLLAKDVILYTTSKEKLSDLKQPLHLRSAEMIELLPQQVFCIKCKIEYQMLSPSTDYVCYLVFKLSEDCQGLHCPVKVRDILRWKNTETKILFFRSPKPLDQHDDADWVPEQREDGFMEVIVWKFNSKDDVRNNHIPMHVKLIAFEGTMSGLIAFRLEVRPML